MRDSADRLTIRAVDAGQAPLVRRLMLAGFAQLEHLDPPSSARWESNDDVAAAVGRGDAAIAWLADEPAGSVRWEPEGAWIYINRLAVVPEARRRGVASALMAAAEVDAARFGVREAQVEMRSVLTGNQAFFRGLGYQVLWIRPHPRNPESTTVRMCKVLV